jgi:4-amino-4-deoxy-L-arabinose transferase-like glycosyltransferase
MNRMVDDDEGYYALAGRAMMAGRAPYVDFFFPQMPLGAFAYGALRPIVGAGLAPLRLFAALCATGTALLVYHAARRRGGPLAGIAAAMLFSLHTLVWEWAVTVKTFPLGLLFGTAALVLATSQVVTARRAALVGMLAGLAVGARALSLPVIGAIGIALWARPDGTPLRRALVLHATAGFAAALLPLAGLFAQGPAAFWFDNIGYHALRSPGVGLVKDIAQKLDAARAVFLTPLGAARPDATGLQSTALVVGSCLAWRAPQKDATVRAFAVAAALVALVSFLPSPVWAQYFVAAVPPASVVVGIWLARPGRPRWLVAAALVAYGAVAVPSFRDRIVAVPTSLRPAAVDAVGRALDAVTREGDRVAAHWPSYLVASERRPLDAASNQFARLYSERVSAEERIRYHLYTEGDFRDALYRREARAFVVGAFTVPETALSLKAAAWTRVAVLPGATIWVAPGGPP